MNQPRDILSSIIETATRLKEKSEAGGEVQARFDLNVDRDIGGVSLLNLALTALVRVDFNTDEN